MRPPAEDGRQAGAVEPPSKPRVARVVTRERMNDDFSPLFAERTPGLDRIAGERADGLRAMTMAEAAEISRRIHSGPRPQPIERECGLIERQRLLSRLA